MEIINHGSGIIEYRGAIENPYQVIANVEELDSDSSIHEILPAFDDWAEGFVQPDGVWRAVNVKGRNKVFRWSGTRFMEHLNEAKVIAAEKVVDPIWEPLKRCVHSYADTMEIPIPKIITRNIDLRVYATGKELGLHTDTNNDGPVTHHSLVIYLNDDYEGGELYFSEQDLKIKPEAGSIVAFPATTLHRSLPVTKGEKWHSPCFWYEDISLVTSGKEPPDPSLFW